MAERKRRNGRNHRGNFDIIADILNASGNGVRKTHLMYHCNLSFRQLKSYSYFLLKNGLLRMTEQDTESTANLFETTDKGKRFLRVYNSLKALMN